MGSRLINTDYKDFAPRVGVAYSPSDKWSIRLGYGISYSDESKNSIFDLERGLGGRTGQTTPTTYRQPTWSYTNFIHAAQLPASVPIGLTWGASQHLPNSYTHQWIANVQHTLSHLHDDGGGFTPARRVTGWITSGSTQTREFWEPQSAVLRLALSGNAAAGIQYLMGDANGNYEAVSGKLTQHFAKNLTSLLGIISPARALDDTRSIRGSSNDSPRRRTRSARSLASGLAPSDFNISQRLVASISIVLCRSAEGR